MINLLPHERRIKLKSLYKERLIIVALFTVAVALVPLILVLGFTSFMQYSNINSLESEYNKMIELRQKEGVESLTDNIKDINRIIGTFQGSLKESRTISADILSIVGSRGTNIRITSIESSSVSEEISIKGIAKDRESIIGFSNMLSHPQSGACKSISVPVTTYTKKVDVPFTILCILKNDA